MRLLLAPVALFLDVVVAVLLIAVLFVSLTGGGVYTLSGQRISLTSAGNPLAFLTLLVVIRWYATPSAPFLAVLGASPSSLRNAIPALWENVSGSLERISDSSAWRVIGLLAVIGLAVRLANAYLFYGFAFGDDVEIHELTFASLLGYGWEPWGLRNPFYPLTFIFPIQWVVSRLGIVDTDSLVFAGRCIVAFFSTLTIFLLFVAAKRAYGLPAAVLAAAFLAFSALHIRLGSTELPRPVATCFLVLAFALTQRPGVLLSALAGVCIGIAGAMRFAEAVFIVPCICALAFERRLRDALVTAVTFAVTWLGILGTADALYWGQAFYSLTNALDYGVVKGLSSRGYEPFHWYLSHLTDWTTPFIGGLALLTIYLREWRLVLWTWIPVVALSVISHKEARYMVPVVPFLCLSAAHALWRSRAVISRWNEPWFRRLILFGLLICGVSLLHEVSRVRFPRSESSVSLAVALRDHWRTDGVAVEQLWRIGGRLYVSNVPTLLELVPERLSEPGYLELFTRRNDVGWVLLADRPDRAPHIQALQAAGFVDVPDQDPWFRVLRRNTELR